MINLTPLRMRALRIIHQRPWIDAQDLGYELNERGHPWNHPAQATRFGSKQVTPLVKAGLVRASDRTESGHRLHAGWRTLRLTKLGEAAMARRMTDSPGDIDA